MSNTYTTVQGDMWDSIAYAQLGSTTHTGALMNANQSKLNYYIFPAGVTLVLPEVTPEAEAINLPPWKRVAQ